MVTGEAVDELDDVPGLEEDVFPLEEEDAFGFAEADVFPLAEEAPLVDDADDETDWEEITTETPTKSATATATTRRRMARTRWRRAFSASETACLVAPGGFCRAGGRAAGSGKAE